MQIDNSGSATITFPAIGLRPKAVEILNPFHVFARVDLVGQALEATWRATSTSVDGVAAGTLSIHVAPEPLTLEELLSNGAPEDEGS